MSLNRWCGVGRTTAQPELRITPSSVSVTSFTIAVDRRPDQSGNKETDFIDIVTFGKLAEIVCKYVAKGQLLGIDGRLQTRTFETKDGQKRKAWEIIGENVQFLGGKKKDDYEDGDNFNE